MLFFLWPVIKSHDRILKITLNSIVGHGGVILSYSDIQCKMKVYKEWRSSCNYLSTMRIKCSLSHFSWPQSWLQRKTQDNINYCGLLVTLYMLCMVNAIESWTCIPDIWLINMHYFYSIMCVTQLSFKHVIHKILLCHTF